MTEIRHSISKIPSKSSTPKNKTRENPIPAATSISNGTALTDGANLSPNNILQLQRTIGNQAVQRLISDIQRDPGDTTTATTAAPARPATAASPRQRPAAPRHPSPGNIVAWANFRQRLLNAARDPRFMGNKRGNANATPANGGNLTTQRDAVLADLQTVYMAYDATPTIPNMVKLHHKIDQWLVMYWNHESVRNAGLRTPDVQALLDGLKASIERNIASENAQNGADGSNAVDVTLGKKGKKPKRIGFFDEVGAPIAWYAKLTSEQVKLCKALYEALQDKNQGKNSKKAQALPIIMTSLNAQNIPGFALIKGLFLTAFPVAAGIANVVNNAYVADAATKENAYASNILLAATPLTAAQIANEEYVADVQGTRDTLEENLGGKTVSKNLTRAELYALIDYTGGDFTRSNAVLRGNEATTPDDVHKKTQADRDLSKNELIVSALNKLPIYSGMAYRMMNAFADFDAAVHPGGMFSDLAFMSASMTAEGAEKGGASGGAAKPGALEVYMIIHTKSARQVTMLSALSHETEVLFRPGVRFKVDAIWEHVNGQVPKTAPSEAQMILYRNGPVKVKGNDFGLVKVVEMTEA